MATKVSISKELEARLRACKGIDLVDELIALLDGAKERAAGSNPGLGYKELVALFRSHLGPDLVLPPSPSAGYIVKLVNKAREFGICKENVEQITRGLRRAYPRGPYSLGFIVFRGDVHFAAGSTKEEHSAYPGVSVVTGRPDFHGPDD